MLINVTYFQEEDAFFKLMSFYRSLMEDYLDESRNKLNLEMWSEYDSGSAVSTRSRTVLLDIMYLLKVPVEEFNQK